MSVTLQKANREDMHELWQMQVDAFKGLLEVYHDHDMSPAAESYERILQKYEFTGTTYYFIVADGKRVGGIRIIDKKDGSRKRISPIWIMPGFRNLGYAQQAILEAERIYGSDNWNLDTILRAKIIGQHTPEAAIAVADFHMDASLLGTLSVAPRVAASKDLDAIARGFV